jgi:hypothetical protein
LAEAEPLMRRVLANDEKSNGADHPSEAIDINKHAQLLQATNRLAEAEPLMRRVLVTLLKFTRTTGHVHPNLCTFTNNYYGLLKQMSFADREVRRQLLELSKGAGLDDQGARKLLAGLFRA